MSNQQALKAISRILDKVTFQKTMTLH